MAGECHHLVTRSLGCWWPFGPCPMLGYYSSTAVSTAASVSWYTCACLSAECLLSQQWGIPCCFITLTFSVNNWFGDVYFGPGTCISMYECLSDIVTGHKKSILNYNTVDVEIIVCKSSDSLEKWSCTHRVTWGTQPWGLGWGRVAVFLLTSLLPSNSLYTHSLPGPSALNLGNSWWKIFSILWLVLFIRWYIKGGFINIIKHYFQPE